MCWGLAGIAIVCYCTPTHGNHTNRKQKALFMAILRMTLDAVFIAEEERRMNELVFTVLLHSLTVLSFTPRTPRPFTRQTKKKDTAVFFGAMQQHGGNKNTAKTSKSKNRWHFIASNHSFDSFRGSLACRIQWKCDLFAPFPFFSPPQILFHKASCRATCVGAPGPLEARCGDGNQVAWKYLVIRGGGGWGAHGSDTWMSTAP